MMWAKPDIVANRLASRAALAATLRRMSLFKSASTVSLLTLVSRITGFARETLIAALFGASALTDAFNVAFRIPNLFRRLFAEGAFSQAFVPVLAATRAEKGDEATRLLVDKVATLLAWAVLLTSILGVLAAPGLVWLMASGLQQTPLGLQTAVNLTGLMFPYIAFMSMVALSAGVLNTWRRFAVPAATPVLLNVSMIASAWLGAPWLATRGIEPIYSLAIGVMLGGVLQLAIQIPALSQLGLLPHISMSPKQIRAAWQDAGTRKILAMMGPALLGVGVAQLSLVINTQIASHLTPGSVSWISYADRLMEFPIALLGVALGVVLMPQLAAAKAASDSLRYSAMLDWGLRLVWVLALPCGVALLVFAGPLVSVLYHYGAFTAHDVQQTSLALTGYGVGLLGLVAIKVLAPGFYANQDTRTPVRIAVMVLVFTQVMNLLLVPYFAHAALTLSIALGALVNALGLLIGLRRQGQYQPLPGWGRLLLQVLLATGVLGAGLYGLAQHVDWVGMRSEPWQRIGLMALVLAGSFVVYFTTLRVIGVDLRALLRRSGHD
jgi:putative peptidoglycan lipid II flippase